MFVDHADQTVPVLDQLTGQTREAYVFVAMLGASNYTWLLLRKEDYADVRSRGSPIEPDFAAFVGIDWADQKHCWKLVVADAKAIAPVTESSGHSRWVHVRWACPTFLRQTFHEFAACSISRSEWARVFYDSKIAAGKSHHVAVRALAYKWIRVLFRCWKDGRPYDEQTYLQALAKRNSPFKLSDQSSTKLVWKTLGGFKKLSTENS